MINIKILTGYPEMFPGGLAHSLMGKALKENIFKLETINLHDFGIDNRKSVDDEPFGGGPGMILRPDVVEKALIQKMMVEELLIQIESSIQTFLARHPETDLEILCRCSAAEVTACSIPRLRSIGFAPAAKLR